MKKNNVTSPATSSLRCKAEEQLKDPKSEKAGPRFGQTEQSASEAELVRLNHELEVHQIEMELQNEALQEALHKAETAIALYDFSPVGSLTLDREGVITHLNLSAAKMLGWNRSVLENMDIRPFVSQETLPQFNVIFQTIWKAKIWKRLKRRSG